MRCKPLVENRFERLDEWLDFQLFDDFGNESLDQKPRAIFSSMPRAIR